MDEIIQLVLDQADFYAYPAFRIAIDSDRGALIFGPQLFGTFVPSEEPTTLELDHYHHTLLHHADAARNLAGVASVIYWGFATFGDNYARKRVHWFLDGHRADVGTTALQAQVCLSGARTAIANQQLGNALGSVGIMPQLRRTPFASKVIAFLAPELAGIYDNRIGNGLDTDPRLREEAVFAECRSGVGAVTRASIRARYAAWCEALQTIASTINANYGLQLRPVDVERAIFAAIGG